MKTGMRWMVLAVVVLVSALVSTGAGAVWPDTDPDLLFNMNFQIYDNPAHTTTDAKNGLVVGTLDDYNNVYPNVFGETGIDSYDANFAEMHDSAPGKGVPDGNDVKLKVPTPIGMAIFDLGGAIDKHTWTFWFNVPNLSEGTILRHEGHIELPLHVNEVWEIRIFGGKLHFYHKNNSLRMETASSLSELGLAVNTWYSAAIVIDRSDTYETSVPTMQLSTKIYIDGLEVPVIVTYFSNESMDVDPLYDKPLWIGAGEREFDGLLDNVRLFDRDLNAIEVSILNQPDTTKARALLPIPGSENVVITTDLTWDPADGAATQEVYFGTDPGALVLVESGGGGLEKVANNDPQLGGPLDLDTEYFWYVKTNGVDGPLWSFITETGKALNPSPADGEEDVNNADVTLSWSTPSPAAYTVYVSTVESQLDSNDLNWIANDLAEPCLPHFDPCDYGGRGQTYYWRVDCNYVTLTLSKKTIRGNKWRFRTNPYDLVFNTSDYAVIYADRVIPAYGCVDGNGWTTVVTGSLDGTIADGNAMAVFNFPSGFNYDRRYDIIVVPQYRATDIDFNTFPTPLAIHTTGNFYFDGRIQIAGDDILTSTQANTFARSGGYPGPKNNQDSSVFSDRVVTISDYWKMPNMPVGNHGRFGTLGTAKNIFIPTALGKSVWGPGQPVNPPYKGGGGGGSGGVGGEAGRGYFFGIFSGGPSYGDEEVPIPFGGSSGGWGGGSSPGGAAGGGGIEIVASGNVVLDTNSQIIANGGGQLCSPVTYPAGGGGGGSVRIIAGGSVTNKGIINVNGGIGGDGSGQGNNTGGGGAGGRVATFWGTSYTNNATITANGGAKGTYSGTGLATDGQNGTIINSNLPRKASAPTPVNGDKMAYCNPDPCNSFKLKWYSGYGGTTDVVYCDTFYPPTTPRGTVAATRGQHTVTMSVSSGNTYYWKVVTDGAVSSDDWSFKTVKWQCPFAISDQTPHVGGPEWDFNHDCVIDFEDLAFFVGDWVNEEFGAYILDNPNFDWFADEWKQCINRTDGGCAGL